MLCVSFYIIGYISDLYQLGSSFLDCVGVGGRGECLFGVCCLVWVYCVWLVGVRLGRPMLLMNEWYRSLQWSMNDLQVLFSSSSRGVWDLRQERLHWPVA